MLTKKWEASIDSIVARKLCPLALGRVMGGES